MKSIPSEYLVSVIVDDEEVMFLRPFDTAKEISDFLSVESARHDLDFVTHTVNDYFIIYKYDKYKNVYSRIEDIYIMFQIECKTVYVFKLV